MVGWLQCDACASQRKQQFAATSSGRIGRRWCTTSSQQRGPQSPPTQPPTPLTAHLWYAPGNTTTNSLGWCTTLTTGMACVASSCGDTSSSCAGRPRRRGGSITSSFV